MLAALALPLALLSPTAAAGDLDLFDPLFVARHDAAYAVYGPNGYGGMATMAGSATKEGGAVLVVRFTPAGDTEPAWLEGISVDSGGALREVVHREGSRIRTLAYGDYANVTDSIADVGGDAPLRSSVIPAMEPGVSPWLAGLLLVDKQPTRGTEWAVRVLDGSLVGAPLATLKATGRQDVGGGRRALVGELQLTDGSSRSYFYSDDGLSAIIDPQARVQWVAVPLEQVQAMQDKTVE